MTIYRRFSSREPKKKTNQNKKRRKKTEKPVVYAPLGGEVGRPRRPRGWGC